jgi:hypothetical protein
LLFEKGVLLFEKGVLLFEKGVLLFEKGVLLFEKGVLLFEKGVLLFEIGVLLFEKGVLLFEKGVLHLKRVFCYLKRSFAISNNRLQHFLVPSVQSCFMPRHLRHMIYQLIYGIEYLGLGKVMWYQKKIGTQIARAPRTYMVRG